MFLISADIPKTTPPLSPRTMEDQSGGEQETLKQYINNTLIILELMELKAELYQQQEINLILRNDLEQLQERFTKMNDNNRALIEQTAVLKERLLNESKMKANIRTTKYDTFA